MNPIVFEPEKVEERWKEYGYQEVYLQYQGQKTRYKAILKDGRLIAIVSRSYRLIPLEVSQAVAERAAGLLQAEKVRDEKVYSEDGVPIRQYLVYDLRRKLGEVKGVEVGMGLTVVNSVDGSTAFSLLLTNVLRRGDARAFAIVPSRMMTFLSPTEVLGYQRYVHAGKKPVDAEEVMVERIVKLATETERFMPFFQLWAETTVDEDLIQMLRGRLPRIYLPPSIQEASLRTYVSVFDLYVEIAQRIWESARIGISRKIELFRALHSIMKGPTP
ncbi:MAG: hypothetical protein QXP81_09415 [Nitrososphaerota archaeon]